jgi:hypothetical protein
MSHHSLLRIWKQDGWIRRLSGLMYEPSTAQAGVKQWIALRRAIPASRSASQGKNALPVTHGICGHTLPASPVKSNPSGASSKTLPTIYRWDLNRSAMTWATWVTRLRQACLARKKWVRRTAVSGCSSWPTVTVTDASIKQARPPEKMIRLDKRNVLRTPGLAETILRPNSYPYSTADLPLHGTSQPYQTAKVLWPSPRAQEPSSTSSSHGNALGETAKAWPTPLSRDWKDTQNDKGGRQESVAEAAFHFGRHTHATFPDGKPFPMTLNPAFTEWLMGWPIGWTASVPAVTGWCRWQQRMRGALSALVSIRTEHDRLAHPTLPA